MDVEVLYFDGCPNHEALLPHLRELLARSGATGDIDLVRIEDVESAEREHFLGSPTIRIDGVDVEPGAAERTDFGLKCRLFVTPDGLRGVPADAWVLAAMHDAEGRLSGTTPGDADVLRSAWDAFARGDVDAATAPLHPQMRWYPAGEPDAEGACHDREEAAAFIRQALGSGLTADLLDVREAGGKLVAIVHTQAPPEWGRSPEPHGELVTVRDGKITEMVIYETVEDALVAAGLNPSA